MHKLGHAFFQRNAKKLAQDLIGAVLVRRSDVSQPRRKKERRRKKL
jgi:3-methyladenine DNA glycosylase Mpg